MSTRFYIHRTGPSVSLTPNGAWDDTAGLIRGRLRKQKDTLTQTSVSRTETSTDATFDALLTQYTSDPLDTAQSISGTFDLCAAFFESNADANMVPHIHVWVSQGDTSTPRGVLLTDFVDTQEFATTDTGLQIPQQTLSSVSAQVGDRIVVEIGYQAQNTTATGRTGRVRHGGNDATDMSAGDTTTSHPGWCEFGTTIADAETRINWASKFYLGGSSEDATAIPPLTRGAWDVTTSVAETSADVLRTATPGVASSTMSLAMTTTTANTTRLLHHFVSAPLNAGTIPASTFHITGLTQENATDQDVVFCVHLYLMKQNGDVRATLVNLQADADADNEWPITTPTGRQSDGFAIASQAITQDDRLVLEVGGKQLGTPAANGNIQLRQGGTGSDAQIGDTDTTRPSHIGVLPDATPRPQGVIWVGI